MELGVHLYKYELSPNEKYTNAMYSGVITGITKEEVIDDYTGGINIIERSYNILLKGHGMCHTSDISTFDISKEGAIRKTINKAKNEIHDYEEKIKALKAGIDRAEKDLVKLKKGNKE